MNAQPRITARDVAPHAFAASALATQYEAAIGALMHDATEGGGVTGRVVYRDLLRLIAKAGGSLRRSVSVADRLGVGKDWLHQVSKRLEAEGLVTIETPHGPYRGAVMTLTAAGRARLTNDA